MTVTFSKDFSGSRAHWPALLSGLSGEPDLHFLEIGCYEGQATLWLMENVLVNEGGITVIDPFYVEDQWETFQVNLFNYWDRVQVLHAASRDALPYLLPRKNWFDFIYVDGSHRPADVLFDAVVAWELLKEGGMILFDDYDWPAAPPGQDVKTAVDALVFCYDLDGERSGRDQYLIRK